MRKFLILYLGAHLIHLSIYAQDVAQVIDFTAYFKKIEKADSLYYAGQYGASAQAYSDAFMSNGQGFFIRT